MILRLIHNQFDSQANRGEFLYLTPLSSKSWGYRPKSA